MSPIIAGIGGLLVGLAIGWFIGLSVRSGPSANAPELASRQKAMEEEHKRLAHELSKREKSIAELSQAQVVAVNAADENRRLLRRVQDLESALKAATSEDTPSQSLEMQLAMALRERDAALKTVHELEARRAIDRSRPPPGEYEPPSFDALPDLDATHENEEAADAEATPETASKSPDAIPAWRALPTMPPPTRTSSDTVESADEAPTETDEDEDVADDAPTELDEADAPADQTDRALAEDAAPYDFTVITGIGPATQTKLVDLGYTRLSQLAELSDEGLEELERTLGSRRPSRDDWRGQAEALLSSA